MQPIQNIAVRAARSAGNIIVRAMQHMDERKIIHKAQNDYVSDVDQRAEQEIIQIIRRAYPSHAILAEESGQTEGDDFVWIIDPLDGTTNYLHHFPHFAVSIAIQYKGRLEHGIVYDPLKEEMFTATRGEGAILDNRRLRVSALKTTRGALIGTGIPFRNQQYMDDYLQMLKVLSDGAAGIRRAGSAALDLAYVAAGRLDGFWELGLKPWDMAAGVLLISEAGGVVTDLSGQDAFYQSGNLLTANPKLHQYMQNLIDSHIPSSLR
ncbi:MAG: inositol monophosphatase [Gammaproteobacteria bacterium]|nr:inositol monophosphatase [Gammaproteobacteria bacterium]